MKTQPSFVKGKRASRVSFEVFQKKLYMREYISVKGDGFVFAFFAFFFFHCYARDWAWKNAFTSVWVRYCAKETLTRRCFKICEMFFGDFCYLHLQHVIFVIKFLSIEWFFSSFITFLAFNFGWVKYNNLWQISHSCFLFDYILLFQIINFTRIVNSIWFISVIYFQLV